MIFGLMLCEECTRVLPTRHHCVIFFSLFFAWSNYMNTIGTMPGDMVGKGIQVMASGDLLSGMLWSCMLVYAIDRKYVSAAAVCCVAALKATAGLGWGLLAVWGSLKVLSTGRLVNSLARLRSPGSPLADGAAGLALIEEEAGEEGGKGEL